MEIPQVKVGGKTFRLPFADRLPPLTAEERAELKADIAANGIQVRVLTDEDDNVIDGANRVLIASELRLKDVPTEVRRGLTQAQKEELADNLNLHRRHLTQEQKREIITRKLKAAPQKSNRRIAAEVGVDDKTVGTVRETMERRAEIPHVATHTDTKGRSQPAAKPKPPEPEPNPEPEPDDEAEPDEATFFQAEGEKEEPDQPAAPRTPRTPKQENDAALKAWNGTLQAFRRSYAFVEEEKALPFLARSWTRKIRKGQIDLLKGFQTDIQKWIDTLEGINDE